MRCELFRYINQINFKCKAHDNFAYHNKCSFKFALETTSMLRKNTELETARKFTSRYVTKAFRKSENLKQSRIQMGC